MGSMLMSGKGTYNTSTRLYVIQLMRNPGMYAIGQLDWKLIDCAAPGYILYQPGNDVRGYW